MKLQELGNSMDVNRVLYHDNSAVMNIKQHQGSKEALSTMAGQFEAMFLQIVLRQMRSSSDVLSAKNSPFSYQNQGVFRDMYDGQLAIELAQKHNAGIAQMLIKQLSPVEQSRPVEVSRFINAANEGRHSSDFVSGRKPPPVHLTAVDARERITSLFSADAKSARQGPNMLENPMLEGINTDPQTVASLEQVLKEAGMTTAFAQPLLKTMEW